MLRCSVEMRQRYSTTKKDKCVIVIIIVDFGSTSHVPCVRAPGSRHAHLSQKPTTLSTQRPRQKGTTKSLHDMSSMIVLAQTEGASN